MRRVNADAGFIQNSQRQPCTRSLSAQKSKRGESQNSHYSCYKSNVERNETKCNVQVEVWVVVQSTCSKAQMNGDGCKWHHGMAGGPHHQEPDVSHGSMQDLTEHVDLPFLFCPGLQEGSLSSLQVAPINYINQFAEWGLSTSVPFPIGFSLGSFGMRR